MNVTNFSRKRLGVEEAKRRIEEERERILGSVRPSVLILFGSAARGEMHEASDLDFIAILESEDERRAARERYYGTISPSGTPVDILFLTRAEFEERRQSGGVCFVASREGIVVHDSCESGEGGPHVA